MWQGGNAAPNDLLLFPGNEQDDVVFFVEVGPTRQKHGFYQANAGQKKTRKDVSLRQRGNAAMRIKIP